MGFHAHAIWVPKYLCSQRWFSFMFDYSLTCSKITLPNWFFLKESAKWRARVFWMLYMLMTWGACVLVVLYMLTCLACSLALWTCRSYVLGMLHKNGVLGMLRVIHRVLRVMCLTTGHLWTVDYKCEVMYSKDDKKLLSLQSLFLS